MSLKHFHYVLIMNLRILRVCIDSGFQKQLVERFCNPREIRGVYSVKGVAGTGRPLVSLSRKKQKGGTSLVLVGVDTAKEELYGRLKIDNKGPGYCHFPIAEPYSEKYFKQLTSEKFVTKFKNGRPHRVWIAKRSRNEALDCRIYAMAALEILNPNLKKLNENMKKHIEQLNEKRIEKPKPRNNIFDPSRPRGQKDYVNAWMDW